MAACRLVWLIGFVVRDSPNAKSGRRIKNQRAIWSELVVLEAAGVLGRQPALKFIASVRVHASFDSYKNDTMFCYMHLVFKVSWWVVCE